MTHQSILALVDYCFESILAPKEAHTNIARDFLHHFNVIHV
jgi:hypothetical protein